MTTRGPWRSRRRPTHSPTPAAVELSHREDRHHVCQRPAFAVADRVRQHGEGVEQHAPRDDLGHAQHRHHPAQVAALEGHHLGVRGGGGRGGHPQAGTAVAALGRLR